MLPIATIFSVILSSNQAYSSVGSEGELIARGLNIFLNETFDGNGRTCATCHRLENNFTIDPAFISTLPDDDPLFVAEFNPNLQKNFENPKLLREFGLILENVDGFDDLENKFTLRGVPHTLALRTSIDSPSGPRTGWSGDGAPDDGSLRSFTNGAVIQHFTKTLNRVAGVDFRLPTDEELDALEAFQLALGRQEDLNLPLPLKGATATRGQKIFLDASVGKCATCHANAGANANFGGQNLGNLNFNLGIEDLPNKPQALTGEYVPPDDGFGTPGNGTFNTPPLVEAADTGPFFHNNAIDTIEGAVAFYSSNTFNNSPAGRALANSDPDGVGIRITNDQVVDVAGFLRVINALENIQQSIQLLELGSQNSAFALQDPKDLLNLVMHETEDAIMVLEGGELEPAAVSHLKTAKRLTQKATQIAANRFFSQRGPARTVINKLQQARDLMIIEDPESN
ncbi:MAG: hypothetical protein QNJ46_04445 [Leptolyngbyaceae cyanobacterium MO_188.B28]|nr:hypothetical protein [Leptolyngbyaceae cyanobacterium MO_188.B28]